MNIRHIIASIVLCSLSLVSINSAFAMKEGHHKKPRISAMAEQLGLNDAQKAQIEALEAQHKLDRKALKEKYQISERDSFREEKKALRQSFRAQLHEILTDEQISQLKSIRKNNKRKHSHNDDK